MNVEKFERARRKRNKLADEMADIKDKIDNQYINQLNERNIYNVLKLMELHSSKKIELEKVDAELIEAIKEENND